MMDTVPNDTFIYRHVQSYQVLQRQFDTDSTWIQQKDNTYCELKAGGPYTIDDAHHVMVGDIWILAGQSNMRGYGFFDHDNDDNSSSNNNHGCHVFQSSETWGIVPDNKPVHHLVTSPRSVHHTLPDPTVRDPFIVFDRGASLTPSFVRRYQHALDVPVGVVPCAHGGVTIQQWMKADNGDENNSSSSSSSNTLYGSMLDKIRLVGGQFTGVLWYQGESDAVQLDTAKKYSTEFTRWFRQLQDDLPTTHAYRIEPGLFIIAQLGRMVSSHTLNDVDGDNHNHNDDKSNTLDIGWNYVRSAQLKHHQQQQQLKNHFESLWTTAIVSTLDADMDDHIHLSKTGLDKVGERMADAASALMKSLPTSCALFTSHVTMVHLPYGNNRHWRHILRLDFFPPATSSSTMTPYTWCDNDPLTGFTIHDRSHSWAKVDMIYSARINAQQQVDLYITEKGYQQLVAALPQRQQQQEQEQEQQQQQLTRYWLCYGYGQNPQCNLVTTTNVAALAFGPLPIHVTSLPNPLN